jgi:hypothetical protein
MRLTHDDQMRQAGLVHKTPTRAAGVSARPESVPGTRITRSMLNRTVAIRPSQLLWRARSAGAMRGLLSLARQLK